ncbi:hypothetical protein M2140_000224 [Clostridiales Family XIII bacterium PM5-7]
MEENLKEFMAICKSVENTFDREWQETDDFAKNEKLEREKQAIMGNPAATKFYKERIREILTAKQLLDRWYPPWYSDLVEGIFAELYGLSGLAPWAYDMTEAYKHSPSAKLIGDRLYCLIDGKSCLQPQRISNRRRQQLKRTLLLATPRERLEYGFHEVYLHNGIRITIYSGERTKDDQDVMVFRKYILKEYTFEHLARLGTIPVEVIPVFKLMIKIGFNMIFAGQVRSGKTTFLQIWQRYEDQSLEGLAIATDPETPWHVIMPEAPIMQLIADGSQLSDMTKSLLRGDNDYVLLEEMRDAVAFNFMLDITSTGTMRSKATIHDHDGVNIPYKMASKIRERFGGELKELIAQVYRNFDYAIEFTQLPENRGKKVMKGIIEYTYDVRQDAVMAKRICQYDFVGKKWLWSDDMSSLAKAEKIPEMATEIHEMKRRLSELKAGGEITEPTTILPGYDERRK